MNRDFQSAVAAKEKLAAALRDLQAQRAKEAQSRVDEATADMASQQERLDGITAAISRAQAANDALQEENKQLRTKLLEAYESFQKGKDVYDEQMRAKDAMVEAAQARLAAHASDSAGRQSMVDKLSDMLTKAHQGERDARATAEAYKEQSQQATEAVMVAQRELKRMTAMAKELAQVKTAKQASEEALIQEATRRHTLTQELAQANATIAKQSKQLTALQGLCRSLRKGAEGGAPPAEGTPE